MDLRLYARVLWRFWPLAVLGLVLAIALAFLSAVRVSSTGLAYRDTELWATSTRLLVTQNGFPEGRLYAQTLTSSGERVITSGSRSHVVGIPVVDPGRFNTLAILYAKLATSDPVRRLMDPHIRIDEQIIATPLKDDQSGILLPLIDLAAISTSPRAAVDLARRSANALQNYVAEEQRANDVGKADRVIVQTIVRPEAAKLYQPRSKTMPIVIFLVVMLATFGLALLLENLRPRARESGETVDAAVPGTEQRPAPSPGK